MLEDTDDLKDFDHVVIVEDHNGNQVYKFKGKNARVLAHHKVGELKKIISHNSEIVVAAIYRRISRA